MRLLVIDTSGPECAAGIYDAVTARLLAVRSETIGKGHAEILPGMIRQVTDEAGLPLDRLGRIAVTVGPGSFTGIRVGVAMARGLALSLRIPAVGVSTLQVVAEPVLHRGRPVLALIDARREELYGQLYSEDGTAVSEPLGLDHETARRMRAEQDPLLCGSGAAILDGAVSPQLDRMPPELIGRIGARLAAATAAKPLYIRGADAKPQTGFAVAHA